MRSVKVWDPVVRVFHWGTALLFLANFTILEGEDIVHHYAGYALFALLLFRLLWGLVGTKHARFNAFWPRPAEISAHLRGLISGESELHLSHNPLGAVMVYNLLMTLVLISVTGIMLRSDAFWGIGWLEQGHQWLSNYAMICVGLHLAGVLFETRRSKVNLVRSMITGRKEIPDQGA